LLVAALIFLATYVVIALGRAPGLRLDRTGAALLGASLMVASGTLTLDQAYKAVDLDTLTLLLGMMIIVAHLRLAGFFQLAAAWVGEHAHRPALLLIGVVLVSGLLSAFLVNDTVCLMLTPLVAETTLAMRRRPCLSAGLAMASNIGSTATITGNPQNIMIGSFSRIPYPEFAGALAPVAASACRRPFVILLIVDRRASGRSARRRCGCAGTAGSSSSPSSSP
jgi:Na+/H+ antiporter NhaD/arsenite permease-like protein